MSSWKNKIYLPTGIEIKIKDKDNRVILYIKGPKGSLFKSLNGVQIKIKNNELLISGQDKTLKSTYTQLLTNWIYGVMKGFTSTLKLQGLGFKANAVSSNKLELHLGFSHLKSVDIPENMEVDIKKGDINFISPDLQKMQSFIHFLTTLKKFDPYKNKGFLMEGRVMRLKESKKNK